MLERNKENNTEHFFQWYQANFAVFGTPKEVLACTINVEVSKINGKKTVKNTRRKVKEIIQQ